MTSTTRPFRTFRAAAYMQRAKMVKQMAEAMVKLFFFLSFSTFSAFAMGNTICKVSGCIFFMTLVLLRTQHQIVQKAIIKEDKKALLLKLQSKSVHDFHVIFI